MNHLKEFKSNREKAMSWWSNLTGQERINNTSLYYPGRTYMSLTGREIQLIYLKIK